MGRILAIDFGLKRIGLAVTDPAKIIANAMTTVANKDIWSYLENYSSQERIDCFVVGYPKRMNNQPSQIVNHLNDFVKKLKEKFPEIEIKFADERFTSKIAEKTILNSGINKKSRRDKSLIDKISATIILQSYLDSLKY